MDGIFISYRRDDSAGYAGRLYDRLATHFGTERVFMDVEGIEPGADFVNAIEEAVSSCRVLIVMIGDEWTHGTDAAGRRRLDDPNDFVRLETSAALQRGIRVVPVLVGGAVMPRAEELPEDLKPLTRRQAVEINHKQWDASSSELIATLERILVHEGGPEPLPLKVARRGPAALASKAVGRKVPWVWPAAAAGTVLLGAGLWWLLPLGGPPSEARAPAPPLVAAEPEPAAPVVVASAPKTETPTPVAVVVPSATTPPPAAPKASGEVVKPSPSLPNPTPNPTPAPAPAPVVTPPLIHEFRAEAGEGGTRLCYRVSNADSVTLSPRPGELERSGRDCVVVDVDATTTFTLTARHADQAVRKTLRVSPPRVIVARPVAPVVPVAPEARPVPTVPASSASALPRRGESWVYQSSGKWRTSPKRRFEVTIQSLVDGLATDALRPVDHDAGPRAESRRSRSGVPGFVTWSEIGFEFSPYLGASVSLAEMGSQRGFATPDHDPQWGNWYSQAKVLGQEPVSVPAGSFSAHKVEVWSSRGATGGPTVAQVEPVRVHYLVWYAPEVRRYVKMQRRILSAAGSEMEKDVFELVAHRQP